MPAAAVLLPGPYTPVPSASSRCASASTSRRLVSIGIARPPLTVMSRCSRFLSVFFSGTTWNQIRGPPPAGSMMRVKAEAELVLAHADGAPVVVPVVIAIRRRLEFVAKRGHPEPRERFWVRAVDHQLKLSSHDHSRRWAFSSFSEPRLIGSRQNSSSV